MCRPNSLLTPLIYLCAELKLFYGMVYCIRDVTDLRKIVQVNQTADELIWACEKMIYFNFYLQCTIKKAQC